MTCQNLWHESLSKRRLIVHPQRLHKSELEHVCKVHTPTRLEAPTRLHLVRPFKSNGMFALHQFHSVVAFCCKLCVHCVYSTRSRPRVLNPDFFRSLWSEIVGCQDTVDQERFQEVKGLQADIIPKTNALLCKADDMTAGRRGRLLSSSLRWIRRL